MISTTRRIKRIRSSREESISRRFAPRTTSAFRGIDRSYNVSKPRQTERTERIGRESVRIRPRLTVSRDRHRGAAEARGPKA